MFEYTTRINKRAKRIKLQFCSYRGLIISSPKKLSTKRLDAICLENQHWIQKQQQLNAGTKDTSPPHSLELVALKKSFHIRYFIHHKNKIAENDDTLSIYGLDQEHQIKTLKHWIRKQAKIFLNQQLNEWSHFTQLTYKKLTVRSQKSRWGSCSSTGTISLNDQLLFMPISVVHYIIIHELCHTVHANHSTRFWSLVNDHCPDFQHQEYLLDQHAKSIPHWFRLSLYKD